MNYPSTTQALFALIVMIIVLVFILVYCCWGTFSCAWNEDHSLDRQNSSSSNHSTRRGSPIPRSLVILPYNNMMYVGDPPSRRIFQFPPVEDKPPSYGDICKVPPPFPPYRNVSSEAISRCISFSDLPPTYDECSKNCHSLRFSNECVHSSHHTLVSSIHGQTLTLSPTSLLCVQMPSYRQNEYFRSTTSLPLAMARSQELHAQSLRSMSLAQSASSSKLSGS